MGAGLPPLDWSKASWAMPTFRLAILTLVQEAKQSNTAWCFMFLWFLVENNLNTDIICAYINMGMDQYLLIPFLVGWTSINPSYFDVNRRGTRFWHTAISLSHTSERTFPPPTFVCFTYSFAGRYSYVGSFGPLVILLWFSRIRPPCIILLFIGRPNSLTTSSYLTINFISLFLFKPWDSTSNGVFRLWFGASLFQIHVACPQILFSDVD